MSKDTNKITAFGKAVALITLSVASTIIGSLLIFFLTRAFFGIDMFEFVATFSFILFPILLHLYLWKRFGKPTKTMLVSAFIVASLYYLVVFIFAGPFGCSYVEKSLPIPEELQNGATVIFDGDYYSYVLEKPEFSCGFKFKTKGLLRRGVRSKVSKPEIKPVPEGTEFTVIRRVYIRCPYLACIGADEPGGDRFFLRNDEGDVWVLMTPSWGASYYKDGVRQGKVFIEKIED